MALIGHTLRRCNTFVTNFHRNGHLRPCFRCLSTAYETRNYDSRKNFQQCGAVCHVRWYSSKPKGFISEFIENVRSEFSKNKEMKENLKKFREEAEKLEQSDALKKARQKYESIEAETSKSSDVLKKQFSSVSEKLKETIQEAEKTEFGKKGKEFADELGKTASKAAETVSKSGEQIAQSQVFKSVATGVKAVKSEIDEVTLSRGQLYRAPQSLRKRDDGLLAPDENRTVEANEEATGMVMHKDSKWFQSWQNFKDNNQYVTKLFDLKVKYDESDHVVIRATRTFTDKVQEMFGGVFSKTEMSEVLTEICKMDPNFDKELFIRDCRDDIIPNVLEAMIHGNLEILEDWCHEAVFNTITHPVKEARKLGYKLDSRILDISRVDILAGKMMEQGPVLVINFHAQQIMCCRDATGKVVEGDPEKIIRVDHVWALCRDQNILNPKAAWRIVDLSSSQGQQIIF